MTKEKELLNDLPNVESDETTKEEYILKFIRAMKAIEFTMEPLKGQKRDLRESYEKNNWLTKEEQRVAVKAFRLLDDEDDVEQLVDFYNAIKKGIGK